MLSSLFETPSGCTEIQAACVYVSHSVVSDSLLPHELHSPPGSSIHGILQARILDWVAISFFNMLLSTIQIFYLGSSVIKLLYF